MLKNVFLFTGEERYLLDQEVSRRTNNFLEKFGEDSLFVYNNENWDEVSATQSIFGGGLFSAKKLTIIKGIPLDNAEGNKFNVSQIEGFADKFIKEEGKIPEDNLLVFVSNKPDKRSRFFKFLKANANVKNFDVLKDFEVKGFIRQSLGKIKITDLALNLFVYRVGVSLYRVKSEVEKLRVYCEAKAVNTSSRNIDEIDDKLITEVVFGLVETEAFEFLKLMFKSKSRAIDYLQKMQDQGLNWNAFSGALYWGLKLYITLYHFGQKGIKDPKTIAAQTGINPYSLKQNMGYMNIISRNGIEIENMYKKLIEVEVDIKTGIKTEESFWLETKKMISKFDLK